MFSYWTKISDQLDGSIPAHFSVNFNVSVNESDSELFSFEFATSKNFDCFAISVTNINSRIRLRISIFLKFSFIGILRSFLDRIVVGSKSTDVKNARGRRTCHRPLSTPPQIRFVSRIFRSTQKGTIEV